MGYCDEENKNSLVTLTLLQRRQLSIMELSDGTLCPLSSERRIHYDFSYH